MQFDKRGGATAARSACGSVLRNFLWSANRNHLNGATDKRRKRSATRLSRCESWICSAFCFVRRSSKGRGPRLWVRLRDKAYGADWKMGSLWPKPCAVAGPTEAQSETRTGSTSITIDRSAGRSILSEGNMKRCLASLRFEFGASGSLNCGQPKRLRLGKGCPRILRGHGMNGAKRSAKPMLRCGPMGCRSGSW
jgi:hypothetical protein